MNILVTGSEGYIGQHLIKMLKKKGNYRVFNLDIKDKDIPIDITQQFEIPEKFDTVIHLAALISVNESIKKPTEYYRTNLFGTYNLIQSLNFDNFIFASTGAAESQLSPYARSKRAAEDVVAEHCDIYTTFRFYNVIGSDGPRPSNPDGLFYNLLQAEKTGVFNIFGNDYNTKDGTCVRDYIHVNQVCSCICAAIDIPANRIENLGHGKGWTVKEIVDTYKKVNRCDFDVNFLPRREGDIESNTLLDVSSYLNTKYSLEVMLAKT